MAKSKRKSNPEQKNAQTPRTLNTNTEFGHEFADVNASKHYEAAAFAQAEKEKKENARKNGQQQ
ncbi:hypothetical protein [Bacillus solimangrovi]|uniref:Uncharacterized protein n=1 Tax=Bacillus solimangrovi TaxID=1305675 RepID=A0A1E5LD58_9BACI|nr:hypothetical protein [Bacillus solimangrovi]OEH92011.1 hypothetical protein BFG57_17250 [Bacillus solimangrovi]